ncbi:MAG: capsular biosynthesis protein, partial [Planctomycetes bacterium]|nr:capsular biosynthesis protein [Planctomycetota bacterium]
DGDLRSPAAHLQIGLGTQPGVCEYLRLEASLESVLRPTTTANLDFVSAGRCDQRAIQELARDGFLGLLNLVRPRYDFVLVDSCPVLPVADALLMARYVDGVLLSMMCDYSQVERIQTACQKLASIGARVVGAVVHGTQAEAYGRSGHYLMPVSNA